MGGRESEGARGGWGEEGEGRRERDGGTEWGCGEAEQALRWQHTSRASRSGASMQRFLFPLTHRPSTAALPAARHPAEPRRAARRLCAAALRGYCGEGGGAAVWHRGACRAAEPLLQRQTDADKVQTRTRTPASALADRARPCEPGTRRAARDGAPPRSPGLAPAARIPP